MKKTRVLLISALIAAFLGFVYLMYLVMYIWCTTTAKDVIEDYEENVTFVYDARADLCFAYDTYHGTLDSAPCGDVGFYTDACLSWVADGIWYFQDAERGICMAGGSGRFVGMKIPVPCANVKHLLGPREGRYRIDKKIVGGNITRPRH